MRYKLDFDSSESHLIQVQVDLPARESEYMDLWLPKWRPGRYELGPYVENIVDFEAYSESGDRLRVEKTAYNHWRIFAPQGQSAVARYKYYAVVADAGASFFNQQQVYINGVNLFMYEPHLIHEPCTVELNVPQHYLVACGMKKEGKNLLAKDYDELVDCPLIASPTLQHHAFTVAGITHNLWFQGEARPDFVQLEMDFKRFGEAQCQLFGGFPAEEYHYLFQIHNKWFYHGVEHQNSTVLGFGPGYRMMQPDYYVELLGLCSHELFHAWNVKAIRPADMRPYNYDDINYSTLHYVTEGVTTYYGDLMLLKSGVWDLDSFLAVFNDSVFKRHYSNDGHQNISLEQASYDSWLNGYKTGVPNRKISFYTKGCIAAFILDYTIRKATQNTKSLDTLMRLMYERFGKTGIGYTKADYKGIAEELCGFSLDTYFKQFVEGTAPVEDAVKEAAQYFGLDYIQIRPGTAAERWFGFSAEDVEKVFSVKQIWENTPAVRAGLSVGDEIVAVNGFRANASNMDSLMMHHEADDELTLTVFRADRLHHILMRREEGFELRRYQMVAPAYKTSEQLRNLEAWIRIG